MATKQNGAKAGNRLQKIVNNIPSRQAEAEEIEQWFNEKGQQSFTDHTMKAVHDLITDGTGYVHAIWYAKIISGIRGVLMMPGNIQAFEEFSHVPGKGLLDGITSLEFFFSAFQNPISQAEIIRFGLLTNPKQYDDPNADGIDGVMEKYRTLPQGA